jgi:hypothetical protein
MNQWVEVPPGKKSKPRSLNSRVGRKLPILNPIDEVIFKDGEPVTGP